MYPANDFLQKKKERVRKPLNIREHMVTRLTASIVACMYMAPKKAQSPKTNLYQRNTPTELPFMRLLLRNRGRFTSEDFFCLLKANVCLFKFFV